jgi:Cys-tRNA synthase (O-phospho-L-seryl-tRNA:Cys-tRNA synthase)
MNTRNAVSKINLTLLDIRDEDWNNLVDAKAMADSAKELNV